MRYKLSFSPRFKKSFRNLSDTEKQQLHNKLDILIENPAHPSLRTKRIRGTDNLFECSVNMSIRIIWYYSGESIILADIGHHDVLDKY